MIKVGNPVPAVTDGIVGQLHRGKRAVLLDASSAPGARLTAELIRRSDALVTNFTPMSQARYGIDYERVSALNPELVHCSITAYGLSGPWAHRRGYENQCNAATGMSWRYGHRFGWTLYQPTPINDAGTGILGAYAVAVARFARLKGGGGQRRSPRGRRSTRPRTSLRRRGRVRRRRGVRTGRTRCVTSTAAARCTASTRHGTAGSSWPRARGS
ncbi:hypothetical protein FRAHR75_1370013 [Frankia sp. Hr75.2]|nr:hypothetical protein FRAHR75_1370013 [Frankia sp. Hr75.2]